MRRPLELIKQMISDSPCRKQPRGGSCERTEGKEQGGLSKTKERSSFATKEFADFLALLFYILTPSIGMFVKDCGQIYRLIQSHSLLNLCLIQIDYFVLFFSIKVEMKIKIKYFGLNKEFSS